MFEKHGKRLAKRACQITAPINPPMKQPQKLIAVLGASLLTIATPAFAGTQIDISKDGKEIKETKPPEPRFKIYGWVEGGITINGDQPKDNQNFGHLFTDRANEPLLNQATIVLERLLKPEPGQYDWGFRVQGMFGSDSRFIHYFGELDNTMHEIVQPDIVEAYLNLHTPWLTEGGIDFKIGQFVTLEGAEVINANGNFFYSHSYIFNFGIPFKHTGIMMTTHATKWLDIYTGVVRGVNAGWDDNNDVLAFHGGFGLNFFDGKLTALASTSIGAENDGFFGTEAGGYLFRTNSATRQLHDLTVIWKITDKLTSTTDFNYGQDDGFDAEWYGVAQYFTYAINDYLSVGIRGELWRDDDGFAAAQFGNNEDLVKIQRGIFNNIDPRTVGGGDTTYGAITVGANIKVPGKWKDHVLIRPEVRWDGAVAGARNHPYDDSSDHDQFTAGLDVILSF